MGHGSICRLAVCCIAGALHGCGAELDPFAARSTASAGDPSTATDAPNGSGDDLLVLYTFEEGTGDVVYDRAAVHPPLDVHIQDGDTVTWKPEGLAIFRPTRIVSQSPALKVMEGCRATNQLTIEAWVTPANTGDEGWRRIVSVSADVYATNFMLAEHVFDLPMEGSPNERSYFARIRTESSDGLPELIALGSARPELTHVVYTWRARGAEILYVDGVPAQRVVHHRYSEPSIVDGPRVGDASMWANDYPIALANEVTGERGFLGILHRVAIYARALEPNEVLQHFDAGP